MKSPPPNITKEHAIETYKSLTTTGVEAVKTALLLNGGAAIAFITFLGNLLSKQHSITPQPLPDLKPALQCYFVGLVLAGIAFVLGYLLNLRIYNEAIQQWPQRHRWWLRPAILLVIA